MRSFTPERLLQQEMQDEEICDPSLDASRGLGFFQCDLSTIYISFCESGNNEGCEWLLQICRDRCRSTAENSVFALRADVTQDILAGCVGCCAFAHPILIASCCGAVVYLSYQYFEAQCGIIRSEYDNCLSGCDQEYCECSSRIGFVDVQSRTSATAAGVCLSATSR